MKAIPVNYNLFFDFIDTYLPDGFQHVDPDSPLLLNLERMMEAGKQFFLIGNLIHMRVLFTSKKSTDLIGIEPGNVDASSFLVSVHPDDLTRLVISRTKMLQLGGELFVAKKGTAIISTTLRFQASPGKYINQLIQCRLFYHDLPVPTVYIFQVNTDVSWFSMARHGFQYYVGDDPAYFRYPDEDLLMSGNIFSNRELEILKLVSDGLNSEQIAAKLYLSVHTIATHRRNMLKKSKKFSIVELILDLKKKGLL
jgi:DNA-binding CsgD family transcriptional regulator